MGDISVEEGYLIKWLAAGGEMNIDDHQELALKIRDFNRKKQVGNIHPHSPSPHRLSQQDPN